MKLRLWLRRHLWFWWAFSLGLAAAGALMFGLVLAGCRIPRFMLLIWALEPVPCSYMILWVTAEADGFRRLLTKQLREDVPGRP